MKSINTLLAKIGSTSLILCAFISSASAADIRGFSPGNYNLTEGEDRLCGEGDFKVEGDRLVLGPYYNFPLKDAKEESKGGFGSLDKGCVYESTTQYSTKGRGTVLKSVSRMLCGESERQVITNEFVIMKNKITLDQSSKVDPKWHDRAGGTPHHCAWVAGKKPKAPKKE